jgi:hypothetical protein
LAVGLAASAAAGEPVEGLTLLRGFEATAPASAADKALPDSQDAGERLTHATILFYRALEGFRPGNPPSDLFAEVARDLTEAIRLSASDPQPRRRNLIRGQAAYMLGDVYLNVYRDAETAKALYREAVRYVPGHSAAASALKRLP